MNDEYKTKAQLAEELAALRLKVACFKEIESEHKREKEESQEKDRSLAALHQIGQTILSSLDQDKILDNMARHIADAGIFRSLMVALVDEATQTVQVVRSVYRNPDGSLISNDPHVIGAHYSLADDNITPDVARTGTMQVLEEWDDRLDRRFSTPESRKGEVAYFIPVKHGDHVVAVLATGSTIDDKERTLKRIAALSRLLDQFAIALEHARLYANVQREITDRKQVERALRESERRYRELVEEIPVGITDTIPGGGVVYQNPHLQKMLGYTPEEWGALKADDLYMRVEDRAELVEALNERGEHSFEYQLRRKDGTAVWIQGSSRAQHDQDGETVRYHGYLVDITKRKQADEASMVNLALQRVRNEILQMEREEDWNRVTACFHRELSQLIGYDSLGINLIDRQNETFSAYGIDVDHKRSYDDLPASLKYAMDSQIPVYRRDRAEMDQYEDNLGIERNSVVDVPFTGGTIAVSSNTEDAFSESDIHVLSQFAPVMSEGHRRLQDIAERRQTQEELDREYKLHDAETAVRVRIASMDQPEHLCKVVEEIGQQLRRVGVDHDSCTIQIVNPEGTEFVSVGGGWTDEIMSFLTAGTLKESESNAEHFPWVIETWRTGEPRYDPCTRISGISVDSDVSLIDVPFSHGTLAIKKMQTNAFDEGVIPLLERFAHVLSEGFQRFGDIADRKQAEEALLQSSRLIALGEMAAGLGHELNQPLTVITALAEGLQLRLYQGMELPHERLVEWSRNTLESVERMSALIEHLRVFSRDRSAAPTETVALNEVVTGALSMTGEQLRSRAIEVTLALAEGLPSVLADRYRLEQVLLNLIANARDALEEERGRTPDADRPEWTMRLTIRTQQEREDVLLTVEDNGSGMDDETRKRLFEPFFTTKGPDRGTGLGLSISHAIVKDHGGEIECESQPGEGTKFRVRLPMQR